MNKFPNKKITQRCRVTIKKEEVKTYELFPASDPENWIEHPEGY